MTSGPPSRSEICRRWRLRAERPPSTREAVALRPVETQQFSGLARQLQPHLSFLIHDGGGAGSAEVLLIYVVAGANQDVGLGSEEAHEVDDPFGRGRVRGGDQDRGGAAYLQMLEHLGVRGVAQVQADPCLL